MIKQIPICDCVPEMPLIWTIVFGAYNYWCPYCGKKWHHDEIKKIKNTEELHRILYLYKDFSESYLDAKSTQICSGMKLYGKWVQQEDLPKEFKARAQKIIDGYEFNTVLKRGK